MGAARLDSTRSAHGMHPLLALALLQPHLLIAHASACVELLAAEADVAAAHWRRQGLWMAVATGGLMLGAALAGTALLLWAALPTGTLPQPLLLWLVPLVPLVPGLLALLAARRQPPPAFALLRQQLVADLQLLQQATPGTPP
jgi:hypothetical protein